MARVKTPPKTPAKESQINLPEETEMITVTSIIPNKRNLRHPKKSDPAIIDLAGSLKATGLLNPLIVRPLLRKMEIVGYEIVAGERRWLAAQIAGIKQLPARVVEVDDKTSDAIAVVENMHRANITVSQEAKVLTRLIGEFKDINEIARLLGRSRSWVARRAQLTKLEKHWRDALAQEVHMVHLWSFEHLELIARYDKQSQSDMYEVLWHYYDSYKEDPDNYGGMSVIMLREFLSEYHRTLDKAVWELTDSVLIPKAGACVKCPKRSSVIPDLFNDDDDQAANQAPGDKCLDKLCWKDKATAYIVKRHREEASADGAPLLIRTCAGVSFDDISTDDLPGDLEILNNYQIKKAKKKDKGAKRAIITDGAKAGTIAWVILETANKASQGTTEKRSGQPATPRDPGKPTPLKVRRAKLKARRQQYIMEALRTHKILDPSKGAPHPIAGTNPIALRVIVYLAGRFGTISHNEYCGDKRANERDWGLLDTTMAGKNDQEILDRAWRELVPVLSNRLAARDLDYAGKAWHDVEFLIKITGQSKLYEKLVAEAEDQIPEPKSWAKLNEDGTPRKLKAKNVVKKTK